MTTFETHRVRTVAVKGVPWFIAADACRAIGLAPKKGSFRHHLDKLDPDEITLLSDSGVKLPGTGMHLAKLVSEPGLYKLIQSSNKPEAKRFDRERQATRQQTPAGLGRAMSTVAMARNGISNSAFRCGIHTTSSTC